jgi:tetratricopeptide (TPR) repeat protein
MTAVVFAQETSETATKIDKARRYVSLGMYEEATKSLKDLVVFDEFNGDSRYLYGVALEGLGKPREAAAQLELSLRLAPQQWRAINKLTEVYLAIYNESGANADRKKAYQSALGLIQLDSVLPSAESERNDLQEAKVLARSIIANLESPTGVWRSPWGQDFQLEDKPFLRMTEALPKGVSDCGHICWIMYIKAIAGPDYSGRSGPPNTSMRQIGKGCQFDYDYKLRLTDAGTILTVVETAQRYSSPLGLLTERQIKANRAEAQAAYKAADDVCRKVYLPTTVGKPSEIALQRIGP